MKSTVVKRSDQWQRIIEPVTPKSWAFALQNLLSCLGPHHHAEKPMHNSLSYWKRDNLKEVAAASTDDYNIFQPDAKTDFSK